MNPDNVELFQFMGKDSESIRLDIVSKAHCRRLLPHGSVPGYVAR